MRGKAIRLMIALVAVLAVIVGVAQARAIFITHYQGQTSQVYKNKPSPSIAIDVDRTNHAVYFIGIAFRCPKAGTAWVTKIHPSVKHGKIDKKGNFKYTASSKVHLSWISGHVTSGKITGSFAAMQRGCDAKGTYTATLGGH